MLSRKEENRKKRKRNKALRTRIACAFSATNPSCCGCITKTAQTKVCAVFVARPKEFCPYGARHFVPE